MQRRFCVFRYHKYKNKFLLLKNSLFTRQLFFYSISLKNNNNNNKNNVAL